jgi:DNA replication and repair protein RecF
MVRTGAESAVVRASGARGGRELLIEGEITSGGRTRVQVNRQALRRSRDLLGALRVTVFSPGDLALVKGGPAERRGYLDGLLVACHPKWDELHGDVERILRQRSTLLRQAGGRLTTEIALTLDVWDAKLADAGGALASARMGLVDSLRPVVAEAYDALAGSPADVTLAYRTTWREEDGGPGLAAALVAARSDDVRRAVSTVGPHRDELAIGVNGLPSRTHASQGEQRTAALALRLGGHGVVSDAAGEAPILLLDDVFSELDPGRAAALLRRLPAGQAVLTTAGPLPPGADPARRVRVTGGVAVLQP